MPKTIATMMPSQTPLVIKTPAHCTLSSTFSTPWPFHPSFPISQLRELLRVGQPVQHNDSRSPSGLWFIPLRGRPLLGHKQNKRLSDSARLETV